VAIPPTNEFVGILATFLMEYPKYPQDDRIILKPEVPKNKILIWKKDLDRKKLGYYHPDSISHPAKMSVKLCRYILEKFTSSGDIVLDPMSGISTTLLEASNLGRNAIGVEYESKFVDMSKKSIKLLEKLPSISERGKVKVLQGDARNLSEVLSEQVDGIVFSPPYAPTARPQNQHSYTLEELDKKRGYKTTGFRAGYGKNPENIGNMKYGKGIDAVVMSPPFADSKHHYKHGLKELGDNFKGRKAWENKEDMSYSLENIGNLKHSKVDAIVMSPPFSQANKGGGIAKKGYEGKHGKDEKLHKRHERQFTEDKDNISNLPHGEINHIIMSPSEKLTKDVLTELYVKQKLTSREIAKRLNIASKTSVLNKLQEFNIRPIERWERHNLKISQRQYEIILGTLLGDGCLTKKQTEKNYALIIAHSVKQKEYLWWKIEEISNLFTMQIQFYRNHYGETLSIQSYHHPFFTELHKRFYSNGKKRVTEEILDELTPLSLAVWYMDDGTFRIDKRNKYYSRGEARLSTQGFDNESLEKIKKYFKEVWDIETTIQKEKTIRFGADNVGKFLDIVRPYIIPSMQYKIGQYLNQIDTIIVSPPYSLGHSQGKRAGKDKIGKDRFYGYYADGDKNNIGNIKKHGEIDAVVMSPPYRNAREGGGLNKKPPDSFRGVLKDHSFKESNDPENIGNPPQGNIDAVIMSPPYANSLNNKNLDFDKQIERMRKAGVSEERIKTFMGKYSGMRHEKGAYTDDKDSDNIGCLPHGSVDVILTSPPYAHESTASKKTKLEKEGKFKDRGRWKREFSGKKKPTGSGYSEVDAIITSPPYEGVMDSKRHTDSGICGRDPKMTKMRYNGVDTIITSPPYEDIYGASRHGEKARMQKTKLHKEKRLGFPYTNEQTDNLGNLKSKNYLSEMKKVYENCYNVLKLGGKAIIVTKNFTRNYKMVRLDMDTILLMESVGFRLVDRYFRKIVNPSFWIRNMWNRCDHVKFKKDGEKRIKWCTLHNKPCTKTKKTCNDWINTVEKVYYEDILIFSKENVE